MPMLSYVERHQDQLFTGNAFLPYFLFPEQSNNLLICSTTE